jgi:LCP family protein required for cell wall assembly
VKIKISRGAIKISAVLLAVLLLVLLLFSLLSRWEDGHSAVETMDGDAADDGRLYLDDICYVPNKNLETVLLIGVDKYEAQVQDESYNNSQQADFLMLLVMDKTAETYTALHLNRDTMAEIPVLGVRGENAGAITGQLALAHTYGSGGQDSCRNTVDAVSDLLYGMKIDHYVAFTMDAVATINDLAGGVTVTVLDDLTSVSPAMQEGATLTLDGEMALAYVRTRYGLEDSSNLRRMERQRQYLSALRSALSDKLASQDDFLLKALDKVSPYMVSDYTADQLSRLYDRLALYADDGIQTIEGEAVKGDEFMEFYPDEDALKHQVIQLFYIPLEE